MANAPLATVTLLLGMRSLWGPFDVKKLPLFIGEGGRQGWERFLKTLMPT